MTGVATPGYRVNPPSPGQIYVPAPGTPGGPPIGGQPYYQLPPTAAVPGPGPAMPAEPIYTPPPSTAPMRLRPAGQSTSRRPRCRPAAGPSNVGSQPYHSLPSGG